MFNKTAITLATIILTGASYANAEGFKLRSNSIAEGEKLSNEQIFQGFGCKGKNVAPKLSWSGAPKNTKSYAITAYDPDAPTGSGWWHWFAFNISADTNNIPEGGALPPEAITLKNDYGTTGFGGACPPPGEVHRYKFTIHALDTKLELDSSASNALAGFMVNSHTIAKDTITAVFSR
jgi:hypothetical protein